MKRILLTRSEKENSKLESSLEGFEIISAPMIFYKNLDVDWESFVQYSNLIVTSKYAAKLIADNYLFDVNCYVVGEESAKILEANPKLKITYIAQNAVELEGVCSKCNPPLDSGSRRSVSQGLTQFYGWILNQVQDDNAGVIRTVSPKALYLSGNHITIPFENAESREIYHVSYADKIDESLFDKGIDYIFLYSKNAAVNFLNLLSKHNLLQKVKNSVVISLSEKIAANLEKHVTRISYPDSPTSQKMIDILLSYERKDQE